jgi:C4-type Zn-finger protein
MQCKECGRQMRIFKRIKKYKYCTIYTWKCRDCGYEEEEIQYE